jgi:DNA-binding winged helix-turn-helix (wHTH) protein
MASDRRASSRYCFGPFELDTLSRRLVRDGEAVAIPDRSVDVLLELVSRPGEVISKDALIEAAWKDVAVTDNSLEQAISALRRILGQSADAPYIDTVARRGYRFGASVTRTAPRHSPAAVEAMLAPYCAFVEGRAALETLERDAVERARRVFEEVVCASPDYPSAHVGLANALALHVEATRSESVPDSDAVAQALHHAGEACRLDPSSAEAWSVLGLIAHQCRDGARAVAATQRAIRLEPDNWRHHLRLAYVTWGEERLRAARRALKLFPGVALAHWLAATVYIARQAFAEAEQELVAGAVAQDRQHEGAKFRAVGLHLLLGLLRFAQGEEGSALEEFARELALEERPHIYTARARANAWCAIAGVRLRQKQTEPAVAALERVLDVMPRHPVAMAARAAITRDAAAETSVERRLGELRAAGAILEAAFAEATSRALTGHPDRAAAILHRALELQPMDSSGWTVPVDPLLHVDAASGHWDAVLALLRSRAA